MAVAGAFLFLANPFCQFKGKHKTGACIVDATSGAKFRVLGRHNNRKTGCTYELEVLDPGALDNADQLNPFVSSGMVDVREAPPAKVEAGIKSLDELPTHQAVGCE